MDNGVFQMTKKIEPMNKYFVKKTMLTEVLNTIDREDGKIAK